MPRMRYWYAASLMVASVLIAGCHSAPSNSPQGAGAANPASDSSSSQPAAAQSYGQAQEVASYTVPSGSGIVVRLVDRVGSAISRSGDTFRATVAEPVRVEGITVIPRGAEVTGRVVSARPSGHLETPAELAIELTSLRVYGANYNLYTSERGWRGASHKGHDAKWIGALAGGGALLGALVGHGKGAAIGAGVGAGAGTATAYATGKKDIYLPSETELRFALRRPLTITQGG